MKTCQKIQAEPSWVKNRTKGLVAAVLATLVLAACGSSSSGNYSAPPAPTLPAPGAAVPTSAGASIAGFIAYLMSLGMGDETSEPSPIADSFSVPDDQTNDPEIVS